jgi:hypothetical protein
MRVNGNPLEPRSLYIKQLEERLGKEAVHNIATEAQIKAVTGKGNVLSRHTSIWGQIRQGIGEEAGSTTSQEEDKEEQEQR